MGTSAGKRNFSSERIYRKIPTFRCQTSWPGIRYRKIKMDEWGIYTSNDRCTIDVYIDRKSTRLNSSHTVISYAVFCLKKKNRRLYDVRHNDITAMKERR